MSTLRRLAGWRSTALVLALAGCNEEAVPRTEPHVARLRVRLAVADVDAPEITVYDVGDGEVVGRLHVDSRVRTLLPSHSGNTAAVLFTDGGAGLLAGGVSVIPHKDHIHIFKSAPELLGPQLGRAEGNASATFGDGAWALVFDGGSPDVSSAVVIEERSWLQGSRALLPLTETASHRGIALPFASGVLVTAANGTTGPADVVELRMPDGARTGLFACAEASATASTEDAAIFACRDGVVIVREGGAYVSGPIPYPPGVRAAELVALPEQPFVLVRPAGPATTLAALDVLAGRWIAVPLGEPICDATLAIGSTPRAVALTASGTAVQVDLERTPTSVVRVTGGPAAPCDAPRRPRLAATPGRAWVTSPDSAELVEVNLDDRVIVRRVSIGGVPGALAALGLDARNVDLSTGSDAITE
jgi:hypothetical protein